MPQKSMPSVLIIANCQKPETSGLATQIEEYLENRSVFVQAFSFQGKATLPDYQGLDLAITLGGDGTVLFAARSLATKGVPILPVNLGNFGFITEVAKDEWAEDLESFLDGSSLGGRRLMAQVKVFRKTFQKFESVCLNDAVISGAGISKIISLSAFLTNTEIGKYRADGIIVATPTGSTAYSAAAGGPILHPEIDALILNPICPFTLSHRPLVLPGGEKIRIVIDRAQRTQLMLTLDGQLEYPLEPEDEVIVTRAENPAIIVNSRKRNFYEVLRTKLNWSGGPDA
ncbi:MAG: NAD(+)/NADH kinase [Spirochaetales bacterium]|nr:NAD(+)/NADH kinase [Spirochaetales bacterium]